MKSEKNIDKEKKNCMSVGRGCEITEKVCSSSHCAIWWWNLNYRLGTVMHFYPFSSLFCVSVNT